jgi:tetratricopeptide (TPR) repeat protein
VIRSLLVCCLSLAALLAGENLAPHQGTVVLTDRVMANVWVVSETTEGVVATLDDKRDSPTSPLERKRYVRVDYVAPKEVFWLRGDAFATKGQWAEAAAQFLESTTKKDTWYTRENSFLRAAEAFVLAGKPDEAIKAIDGLLAFNPKNVQQARLTYLRGQALTKKGDTAGALKAYGELTKKSDVESLSLGALGQGELLTTEGKHDEAAKALAAAFSKLDPGKDSALFGQIGVALAAAQQAAGQTEPAVATLRRLAYGAADGPTRARAQVAWAKLLAGADATLFEAFDHAVIALSARDGGSASTEAGTLVRQLGQKIDKLSDALASGELKAEYRRYLSR